MYTNLSALPLGPVRTAPPDAQRDIEIESAPLRSPAKSNLCRCKGRSLEVPRASPSAQMQVKVVRFNAAAVPGRSLPGLAFTSMPENRNQPVGFSKQWPCRHCTKTHSGGAAAPHVQPRAPSRPCQCPLPGEHGNNFPKTKKKVVLLK